MSAQLINTRYEIIEIIPHADTSPFEVSKARDVIEDRVVTLQLLPGGGGALRASVLAASASAMRLEHPHITRIYDQGVAGESGDVFVASEYLRGITLAERIRRVAPFSLSVAADLGAAIAEALDYAHRSGVIHGDLRPQDVLLSPEGEVKVTNFAYACAASPEADAPSAETDIEAFGALLYEMLTGKTPAAVGLVSPRISNPGVPPALDGIVQKCLHPDRSQRYRTAATLLLDVHAVRDALSSGRSLAWSPLMAEKRVPRAPVGEATVVTRIPEGVLTNPPPISRRARSAAPPEAPAPVPIDNERDYAPVRERSSPFGKIVAVAFVLAVLGVIGLSWYVSKFLAIPNDVLVPNLVGKTFDDAKRVAQQQHFVLLEAGSDYSIKWPEDQIYQQDPLPGRTIKAGKEVSIYRSLGPRLLTVPNLVGTTRDRALRDLQDTGLPLGAANEEYSETVPRGIVLSQMPDKNSMVARNTTVNMVVSKGRQPPDVPAAVQADAAGSTTVALRWDSSPRADSYTVYRVQDGTSTPVAQGLKDTHFTDRGLKPDTSYTYTVTAFNGAGDSGPGDPTIVTTPAKLAAPPTMPGDVNVLTPSGADGSASSGDATSSSDTTEPSSGKMRQFTVGFHVPRHPRRSRRVQFEVQDVTGTNLVYDETHGPGDDISAPVQAFGNKIIFRIFIDSKLVKQQTM